MTDNRPGPQPDEPFDQSLYDAVMAEHRRDMEQADSVTDPAYWAGVRKGARISARITAARQVPPRREVRDD